MRCWRAYDRGASGDDALVSVVYDWQTGQLTWWRGAGTGGREDVAVAHLRQSGVELQVTAADGRQLVWWGATEADEPWPLGTAWPPTP